MRIKEPLNGFRKAQGHVIFHIAMLISSFTVLKSSYIDENPDDCTSTKAFYFIKSERPRTAEELATIILWVRLMHGYLIVSQIFRLMCDNEENDLLVKLVRVFDIFCYLGTTLYMQYFVLLYTPDKCENRYVFFAKSWLMLELFVFYSLIFNSVLFLSWIQLRGTMGKKNKKDNSNRYKFDALDYYVVDIEWCSFQIVPIGLCFSGYMITSQIGRKVSDSDYQLMALTASARFAQLILMSPFRNQKQIVHEISFWKWLVLFGVQCYCGYIWTSQTSTNVTSGIYIVDAVTFVLQFLYYREHRREQSGHSAGIFSFLMTEGFVTVPRAQGADDNQHLEDFVKVKFKQHNSTTATEKFKDKEIKIQKDIYSLAYAAILHPIECEQDKAKGLEARPKDKWIPRINLLNEERTSLFVSAMLVSLVQGTTIMLIVIFFGDTNGKGQPVELVPAQNYFVIIPRLISSIMMHLNVEPDIRQGIELMKYATNHPQKFRPIKRNYEKESEDAALISYDGTKRRAFCAFFLGLNQSTIAIVAEVLVVVYLSSLTSLLLIIMKYVSLAAVVKFDDMYAAALHEHAIQKAVGCKLYISNKRQQRFDKLKQIGQDDNYRTADDYDEGQSKILSQQEEKVEEIKNSCLIKIQRIIFKVYKMYFISLAFYFMPLGALLLSFMVNRPD